MKFNKGSSLLVLIFITTVLSFLLINVWKKNSLMFDIILQKERYYKNFYLAEAFMNYSLFIIKNNYDFFINDERHSINYKFNLNKLKKQINDSYYKNIDVNLLLTKLKEKKELVVSIILTNKNNKKCLHQLKCTIKVNNDEKASYNINNFTISNIL